jgi:aminodeoxyfutalosine synthase
MNKIEKLTHKINEGIRLSTEDALALYREMPIQQLAVLAHNVKHKIHGNKVFYNRNIHIETSNICVNKCRFCSFYREFGCTDSWEYSIDEIINNIKNKYETGISEVHIVGSLHPDRGLNFFCNLFNQIKSEWNNLHIKAFTAVEIEHISEISGVSIDKCIDKIKECGLDSVAGGGAEIFNEKIRDKICPEKTASSIWLDIHRKLHSKNISSNCTMLYGHIESYEDRVDHMNRLRKLQDETGGFNCFIPLKYKCSNNELGIKKEVSLIEDLRNYAVSRLFFDNIMHIKAYWPMMGKESSLLALHFGADDMDGTINDSTKIYSMAGAKDTKPIITKPEMENIILSEGFLPIERDSLFNEIQ